MMLARVESTRPTIQAVCDADAFLDDADIDEVGAALVPCAEDHAREGIVDGAHPFAAVQANHFGARGR